MITLLNLMTIKSYSTITVIIFTNKTYKEYIGLNNHYNEYPS